MVHWGRDSAETLHGSPIGTAAPATCRWSGRLRDRNQCSVDIAQSARFHALATFGATAWDDRTVDCIRGLIEPLVFPLTAVEAHLVRDK